MTTSNGRSPDAGTEEFLHVDGARIHVRSFGSIDAPPLLLIHGTGTSARSWDPMVPLLVEHHRVIAVDLPGCGQSSPPDDGDYGVAGQARRVAAAMDLLDVESAVVVGHSSGGVFATALTEQRPDLVRGLVLINTGPAMSAYIAKEIAVGVTSFADLTDDQIRAATSDGFHPGFAIPKEYVDLTRDVDLAAFGAISAAVRAYLGERALPERLAPTGTPLLVLFGDQDRRWRPSSAATYGLVPGATITMLPGLGHSPNLEDPSRTAVPLIEFSASRYEPS